MPRYRVTKLADDPFLASAVAIDAIHDLATLREIWPVFATERSKRTMSPPQSRYPSSRIISRSDLPGITTTVRELQRTLEQPPKPPWTAPRLVELAAGGI